MTSSEMIAKLEQAQELLAEVYHWANAPLRDTKLKTNSEIAHMMSSADDCICEAIDILEN